MMAKSEICNFYRECVGKNHGTVKYPEHVDFDLLREAGVDPVV